MGARHRTGRFDSSNAIYDHVLPGGAPWGPQLRLGTRKGPWEQGGCVTRGAGSLFAQEEPGMVSRSPLEESTRGRGAKANRGLAMAVSRLGFSWVFVTGRAGEAWRGADMGRAAWLAVK